MGWTFTHREPGTTNKAFFQERFAYKNDKARLEILDCATVGGTVYLKARHTTQAGVTVFALVCLTERCKDYYNFGYKEMDETCGPDEHRAPLRMLDGLSPAANEWAENWRRRVREYHAKKKTAPKYGQTVRFDKPLLFTDGKEHDTFKCVRYGKRGKVYQAPTGQLYRISRIERMDFQVA